MQTYSIVVNAPVLLDARICQYGHIPVYYKQSMWTFDERSSKDIPNVLLLPWATLLNKERPFYRAVYSWREELFPELGPRLALGSWLSKSPINLAWGPHQAVYKLSWDYITYRLRWHSGLADSGKVITDLWESSERNSINVLRQDNKSIVQCRTSAMQCSAIQNVQYSAVECSQYSTMPYNAKVRI